MLMSLPAPLATISTNSTGVINGRSVALPSATLRKSTSGVRIGNIVKKSLQMQRNDSIHRRDRVPAHPYLPPDMGTNGRDSVCRNGVEH